MNVIASYPKKNITKIQVERSPSFSVPQDAVFNPPQKGTYTTWHLCHGQKSLWGMVIPPLIGNPCSGYMTPTIGLMTNPYGNNGSLDDSDSRKFKSAKYLAPDTGGGV